MTFTTAFFFSRLVDTDNTVTASSSYIVCFLLFLFLFATSALGIFDFDRDFFAALSINVGLESFSLIVSAAHSVSGRFPLLGSEIYSRMYRAVM